MPNRFMPSNAGMISFLLATAVTAVLVAMVAGTILLGASSVSGSMWSGWREGYVCPSQETD